MPRNEVELNSVGKARAVSGVAYRAPIIGSRRGVHAVAGVEVTLQQLTQDRARVLSEHFQSAGVEPSRIQANGMGASNPVGPNSTVSGRTRNRRTEIRLVSPGVRRAVK